MYLSLLAFIQASQFHEPLLYIHLLMTVWDNDSSILVPLVRSHTPGSGTELRPWKAVNNAKQVPP